MEKGNGQEVEEGYGYEDHYYGLKVYVPLNSYVDILTPNMMALVGEVGGA